MLAWLVLRMVKRKTLDRIVELAVAWTALFLVPFFIPQIGWPLNIEIGVLTTIAMLIFAVIYFRSRDDDESPSQGPMVLLKGATEDRVHGLTDETEGNQPLVVDECGNRNRIWDLIRRRKK